MSENEALLAVRLARNAVESELLQIPAASAEQLPPVFLEPGAVFVTIKSKADGALRGCIGSLIAYRSLFEDIVNNAQSSAFHDPRFPPLVKEELAFIKFEISFLSEPKQVLYTNTNELLSMIKPGIDGLIIKYGDYQATFLPTVWEELKTTDAFISRLCEKAGLSPDFYKSGELEVYAYQAQKFQEP